ncbi:MAG: endonuclease/exonuclease/phosphatase family protein [Planctomycetota bacterium]
MRYLIAFLLLCLLGLPGCSFLSEPTVRIATFNTALSRGEEGQLHLEFAQGGNQQAKLVAEVLQRTRPDIVLLQEVDYDPTGQAYVDFQRNYLSVSQNGAEPITYEHVYAPPVNTGVLADVDLDGDGQITRPNDCYGYGLFEGHYGMVVLSKHPIDHHGIYTFREALWQTLRNHKMPKDYYAPAVLDHLRLSSKTHADIPIQIGDHAIHLMASHPTPPVFDGSEDRNGRRNFDEIAAWVIWLENTGFPGPPPVFPDIDDGNGFSRSKPGASFVILGDLNADPNDGSSRPGAIQQLFRLSKVNADVVPVSKGAIQASRLQAGKNLAHRSDPAADTGDFSDDDRGPGNLRVDYVLPSIDLDVVGSGVYWLTTDDPHAYLNKASDHKLVWIDVRLP